MEEKKFIFFESVLAIMLFMLALILSFGKGYGYAVTEGLSLWIAVILPSLFPYFFLTAALGKLSITKKLALKSSFATKKLFNTGGFVAYAYLISTISGYPVGSKTVADLKNSNLISDVEAERASTFCSSPSPMFVISGVGTIMFQNKSYGLILLLVNFISTFLTGIIFKFYKRKITTKKVIKVNYEKNYNLLYNCAYSAVISILVTGGLITLFYLFSEILYDLKLLSPLIYLINIITKDSSVSESIIFGLIETTKGLKCLSKSTFNIFTLPISSMLLGFGGISVIAQSIAFLKQANIKIKPFLLAKFLQGIFGFIICLIISILFL